MEKTVINLDSSQLARIGECPVQWYYHSVMKIAEGPKRDYVGATPIMEMGTLGHKFTERWYVGKVRGMKLTDSIDFALDWNPNANTCFCGHAKEYHELVHENIMIGDSVVCKHCDPSCAEHTFRAVEVIDNKSISRVRDRFTQYAMIYTGLRDFEFTDERQLEVGFSEVIYEDDKRVYILEGRIDGLPTYFESPCFVDHKWQEKKRVLFTKSIQFKNYALVAKVNMGYINYVRLAAETDKDTFQRVPITFTSLDHEFWKQKLIRKFKVVEDFLHETRMNDGIPPAHYGNDASCGGVWHPCSYQRLCENWDKKLIQIIADTNYHQRAVWKPW